MFAAATTRLAKTRSAIRLIIAVVALTIVAHAQEGLQWLPQLQTFVGLSPNVQMELLAGGTVNGESPNQQVVFGPSLDVSLAPFFARRIRTLNNTRNNYLNLRIGYRYTATFGSRSSHENRGLIELTPRFPLPAKLVLADRNQLVIVGQQTKTTWLYRNRLTLARSFQIHSLIFTPYIQGQVVYNSDPGKWNRYNSAIGSVFRLNDHLELEPYFQHQHSIDGSGDGQNAIGFKVEVYLHNEIKP